MQGCENLKREDLANRMMTGARMAITRICTMLKESAKNSKLFPIAIKNATMMFGWSTTVIWRYVFPGANTLVAKEIP